MLPRKIVTTFDRQHLVDHMTKDMVGEDRRLRFGYQASDGAVKQYIDRSFEDYGWDNMWFIIEDGGTVIASCHIAYIEKTQSAEMGCTVSPQCRGLGIGQQLFDRGITWARMRGARGVFMQCLSENKVIQHIASKNGMTTVTLDGEKEANIEVNRSRVAAMVDDVVKETFAVYDCAIRKHQHVMKQLLKI